MFFPMHWLLFNPKIHIENLRFVISNNFLKNLGMCQIAAKSQCNIFRHFLFDGKTLILFWYNHLPYSDPYTEFFTQCFCQCSEFQLSFEHWLNDLIEQYD